MASPLVQALSFQNTAHPTQSGISPTDVLGAYNLASSVKQKEYEAKLAQQNAKFGGLAQLGGAGIAAFGPKAYTALMGSSGTAPTTGLIPGMFGGGAKAATSPLAAATSGAPGIQVGGASLGLTPEEYAAGNTALASTPAAAAAPTVAADIGAASAPVDAGGLFSSIFGPSATLASAGAGAGTVASDLAAAAPAAGAAGDVLAAGGAAAGAGGIADALASAGLPDWLASILPFLAAA